MFNNGYGNNNGYMGYTQQKPQEIKMNQVLSVAEQEELRKQKPEFSGRLTKEEYLTGLCTHKDAKTGAISLSANKDGSYTCGICGKTFNVIDDETGEEVETISKNFSDVWQTIKLMNGSVPADVGRAIYSFTGFIEKTPAMYRYSKKYFDRIGAQQQTGVQQFGNNSLMSKWASLYTGPGYMYAGANPGMMQGMMTPQMQMQQQQAMQAQGMVPNQYGMPQQQMPGQVPQMQQMPQQGQAPQYPSMPSMPYNAQPQQGPMINYGAPVMGNGVGYVTPEAGPATQAQAQQSPVKSETKTVQSPDVTAGFKN